MSRLSPQQLQQLREATPSKAEPQDNIHGKNRPGSSWVRGMGYFAVTLALLWGSGLFFSALGFTIRRFKGMVHSIKNNQV